MARREKRELLLQIDAENNADKEFDSLADSADKSTKKLSGASAGLKKLDQDIKSTTKRINDLRDEVRKTGDFELFGDIDKQTRKLNQLTKRRKIIGPQDGEDSWPARRYILACSPPRPAQRPRSPL
jgi:septal ring factor EnvC (AmiA/AmiB activator)